MKFDKMSSLSWSVAVAVLLFSLGTASNDMVSAVPAPVSADDQPLVQVRGQYTTGFPKRAVPADLPKGHPPSQAFPKGQYPTGLPKKAAPTGHPKKAVPTRAETVRIAVPTKGPFRFYPSLIGLPVETPILYKRQDGDIFETVPESHTIDPVEEDRDSETEGGVELSKRRMQVYGAIRYVNPADIRKRDLPSSASATDIAPEEESESESEKDAELFKRRAMVYGRIEYVGHPKYYQRDLPHPTTTTTATAALEE